MSVLALKALDYGAEKLPDKLFEAIPGGFFTPAEKKQAKSKANRRPARENQRRKSEQRDGGRRRSRRERPPPSDYSGYSSYDDTDYERDQRRQGRRRRVQSLGRSPSRGRHNHQRSSDFDGGYDEHSSMNRERADRGPQFAPPPPAEYKPYASPPPATGGAYDAYQHRPSSARQTPGYPPQVNTAFRTRSATLPVGRSAPTPHQLLRKKLVGRSPSNMSTAFPPTVPYPTSPRMESLRSGTPLGASFSPSYEPPLAALLSRPATNSSQPTSHTAARYTPGPDYAPSPVQVNAPIPPPPAVAYAPYNPADYAAQSTGYHAPGNAYPSPPPFYRQLSRSQPSLAQSPYPDNQVAAYDAPPPGRHGSSSSSRRHRHRDDRHHRARSAGHHGRSRSRVTDKFRGRFEDMDLNDKNLTASVGGTGIGAFGGREFEKRHEKNRAAKAEVEVADGATPGRRPVGQGETIFPAVKKAIATPLMLTTVVLHEDGDIGAAEILTIEEFLFGYSMYYFLHCVDLLVLGME
ncbi:hypothetical protein BU23DRAFT_564398 [Bimuria novae-zelandiae CBS 107.79]|uniref:Uncharacterized protein n=1 Tax=Bimuria novae-zelandiae CBS 107.79 TaxID=1447943 RepID=A0A6A5VLK3_9PLEO|nr:hypothetical protein BU23DRAFT_564398 [Bimuria novae-zelandiae CBS 107.79]